MIRRTTLLPLRRCAPPVPLPAALPSPAAALASLRFLVILLLSAAPNPTGEALAPPPPPLVRCRVPPVRAGGGDGGPPCRTGGGGPRGTAAAAAPGGATRRGGGAGAPTAAEEAAEAKKAEAPSRERRALLGAAPSSEVGSDVAGGGSAEAFRSGAYGREEYTNSIVASRDTNISPREVYDSISSRYVRHPLEALSSKRTDGGGGRAPRALDVGAGAGVSTQVLWDMGYRSVDAVDWSGDAWRRFVEDDPSGRCPPSVTFYEMDDERYLDLWRERRLPKFDVIVFNFAVNEGKARQFASELLRDPDDGRLLAPVNAQRDYWLKQTYKAFDGRGNVLWSAADVGAWSVQFQPDVTQDTCQGIWCAPFNGFQKKR